jgi:hypothetical protein
MEFSSRFVRLLLHGLFGLAITATFAAPLARSQAGACLTGPCVSTYHNDPMRDGVNSQETALTQSLFSVPAINSNFGLLTPAAGGATGAVDGLIYAQPLYLSGVAMASTSGCSGTQNIILVATENNSVYAFTWTYTLSTTGYTFALTQCWMVSLNQPGEYAIPFTALPVVHTGVPCNNLMPQSGITSTPVVDTSVTPPVMYVVTSDQTVNLTYTYRIHAVNVNSGTEVTNGSSAPYDLSSVFPKLTANQILQRPGLALFDSGGNANLYVGFGGYCDTLPYSGYVAGLTYNYSTQSFAPIGTNWVFDSQAGSTRHNGGIWMGGAAPALDSTGNVYFSVANGNWNGTTEFGQSVVKLTTTSTGLTPVDFFTPNSYADLNLDLSTVTLCSGYGGNGCPSTNMLNLPAPTGDFDLGAGGVTLVNLAGVTSPVCGSNGELVAGGKEGVIYGVCYSTQSGSTLQSVMGGLDGCGYDCTANSSPTASACTEASPPVPGTTAQCFQGANAGEDQANGSNNVILNPGIRGTEAFWPGSSASPENYLYAAGTNAALMAYQANIATGLFNVVGYPASVPRLYPYPGTVPAVSWNGTNTDTALLWAIDSGGYGQWQPLTNSAVAAKPALLVVYNPIPAGKTPVLKELWESSVSPANAGPGAVKFAVPTIAGGLVFVPGGTHGYAPGLSGGKAVNCTASALATATTPTCGGLLSIYGMLHSVTAGKK